MNKPMITKRIVRGVAVAFGLLGLMWIPMSVDSVVQGIRESDRFALLTMAPVSLLLGVIPLAIAWQNVRRFGPNVIRNVTALVGLVLYACVPEWLYLREPTRPVVPFLDLALAFLPLILLYLLYRFVSRKLIRLAGLEINQQETGEATSETP